MSKSDLTMPLGEGGISITSAGGTAGYGYLSADEVKARSIPTLPGTAQPEDFDSIFANGSADVFHVFRPRIDYDYNPSQEEDDE